MPSICLQSQNLLNSCTFLLTVLHLNQKSEIDALLAVFSVLRPSEHVAAQHLIICHCVTFHNTVRTVKIMNLFKSVLIKQCYIDNKTWGCVLFNFLT